MATILLIDDNEQLRRTLRRALATVRHTVIEAADGRMGLQCFRERTPDLVITDIVMPEMEGIETIMEIRRVSPQAKIIAISGASAGERIDFLHMAQQIGADVILRKPMRVVDLLGAVDSLLACPG